jgi:GTP-binding protein HflX
VISADLIVHVRDISHPDSDAQREDVETVLKEIGADGAVRIEAWNKIDALGPAEAEAVRAEAARREDVAVISALNGEGVPDLLAAVSGRLRKGAKERAITLPSSDGELIAWLHANGEVVSHEYEGLETSFVVRLSDADWARFQSWRRERGG